MDFAAQNDMDLLRLYAGTGDAAAMAEIIRRYAGMVFGVAQRVTRDRHDAEDVAQSCFLELLRRGSALPQSADAESAAGWIHAAALHRALDLIRNKSTRTRHEREAAQQRQHAIQSDEWWEEIAPRVDTAIDLLPENLKTPLILHFLQGLTQSEISANLKVSQPTVSRRLEQAVATLRTSLREEQIVGACAALPALLAAYGITTAPVTLTASLGKMAVAGVGTHALAIPAPAAVAGHANVVSWASAHATAIAVTTVVTITVVWATIHFVTSNDAHSSAVTGSVGVAPAQAELDDEPNLLQAELNVRATDPSRAAAWYRDQLGFTIDSQSATAAAVHRDLCRITLQPTGAQLATIPILEADDLTELHEEFIGRGTLMASRPKPNAKSFDMVLKDLDGNVLTFTSPK